MLKLLFSLAPPQLMAVFVGSQEDPVEEHFASVTTKYKLRFLIVVNRIEDYSRRNLGLLPVVSAEYNNSGLQLRHCIVAGFQRRIPDRKIERYVYPDPTETLGMRR